MVASILGFESRAQLGMTAPRSRSLNITPQNGGTAVHWGGPRQYIGTHTQCRRTWLQWQQFHMFGHGWVDIAYSFGFCNHGYIFAGRGFSVRTAANGTNFGNQNFYAAVWVGGEGNGITERAFNALDWILVEARKNGAGLAVREHGYFTGSECPGPILRRRARDRHNRHIGTEPTKPIIPEEQEDDVIVVIEGSNRAYHVLGTMLAPLASAEQAAIIGGDDWRDKVKTLTLAQAAQFEVLDKEAAGVVRRLAELVSPSGVAKGKVTSVQGAVLGGVNAFRYLNDKHDAKLNTTRPYGS
jgi:hypothetical protein